MKNYNLQIPIDKQLECKLRTIADKEDRALRTLCRRILQSYVDEYEKNEIEVQSDNSEDGEVPFNFDLD